MSAKKATKVYHISTSDAKAAEKADRAIREMLERIGAEEDGGDEGDGLGAADLEGLSRTVMPAVVLCDRASAAVSLAEAELWNLAVDALDTVAEDAAALCEAALEEDEGDYVFAQALKAEALALGALRAVAAKRGEVAACLLGAAAKEAFELIGVKVASALG
ncbi:hypothetical protein [Paratractidigestivibacter faecalis]|uniref:hypothetical protein n=1 Tax=Paratractidigestivibacter faecalis TaxID=2292441 RepID=UPI003AB5DCE6